MGNESPTAKPLDCEKQEFEFGEGGVPWPLLLFYLSFLVFFVWYVFEYQVPEYLSTLESSTEQVAPLELPK